MEPINFAPKRLSGSSTVSDLVAIAAERLRPATATARTTGDPTELLRVFDEMAVEVEAEALAGFRAALTRLREDFRRRVDLAAKMCSR